MGEESIERGIASRVCWETLDEWARGEVQGLIQEILEAEVTELLGRSKSQRRPAVDSEPVYRNGHGKPRRVTLPSGTIEVRRPRVRGLEERFESRILPLFVRRSRRVDVLLPELYLHGLSHGDFDLALGGLLGEKAPISASTVARLKEKWQGEYEAWSKRDLSKLEVVYLWADGIYVKAGLEKEKAAMLVVVAGLSDGSKQVVSVSSGYRESTESWSAVLRDLKERGFGEAKLVIADGHLGIWGALRNVYPKAGEQRCWNHRIVNILDKVPKKQQTSAKLLLRQIPYAESREEAEKLKGKFQSWCRNHGLKEAGDLLDRDWDRMVAFYSFPKEHWTHLRTSNPVESPFAAVRLRTDAAKRYKKTENATAVIWKMLLVVETNFRKLNEPELAREVYLGVKFANGERVKEESQEAAA
jgi:putative transposase